MSLERGGQPMTYLGWRAAFNGKRGSPPMVHGDGGGSTRDRSIPTILLVVVALIASACLADDAETLTLSPAAEDLPAASTSPDPEPEPTTTTTTRPPTTTTEPPKARLIINGVGDTNLDPDYIPVLLTEGYDYAFSGLDDVFATDDLTVVNLECAASTSGSPTKRVFNFNCGPDPLPAIRRAGVDVVNLANNHGADYGFDALVETRRNAAAAGLLPVGAGINAEEAHQPAMIERGGWRIAVLGFNAVLPGESWLAGPDRPGMADGTNLETMAAAVRSADEKADLVVVTIHWGRELDLVPRDIELERAKAMIDAGADIIFGHHSHRLQPLEMYEGRPVAWSLGNFVWPRFSLAGSRTAIAQVTVEPDGSMSACLIPVDIVSHGHPVIQEPGVLDMPGPVCDRDEDRRGEVG